MPGLSVCLVCLARGADDALEILAWEVGCLFIEMDYTAALAQQACAHARDGLARLNAVVPLATRQAVLDPEVRALHRLILRRWPVLGRPPAAAEVAAALPALDLAPALERLFADDLIVSGAGAATGMDRIEGAYPFTMAATDHKVIIGGVEVQAMCAVDALAISPMLGCPTRIESRCRISREPVVLEQYCQRVSAVAGLAVGIHWSGPQRGSCTAHSLCREMVFLLGADSIARWREQAPDARLVYSLAEALALGANFFRPLLPAGLATD